MKKEEAEAVLGRGDLGPIEDYLEELATEDRLPAFALGMCLLRLEEAAPALRAVLAKAAASEPLSSDEGRLLFRGGTGRNWKRFSAMRSRRDFRASSPVYLMATSRPCSI